jgi:glycosyltransferase involved in cell wall biosynthesis
MRIALVHAYPVHRRAVGGTTRLHALAQHLAPRHEVHVFAHAHGDLDQERQAAAEMAELGVTQHLFPRPPASWLDKARWALDRSPYFVNHNRNPALEAALAALDRQRGLDVAHVELITLEPLLRGLGPGCARVLAEQELMSVTIARLRAVPLRHKSPYQHYIALELPRIRRFEAEALRRFDRLFAINDSEAACMAASSGRVVEVLPHVVDTHVFTPGDAPPDEACVLFVGNYGHHPNVEAAFWLMEEIWPAVRRQLPGARVRLVGPGLGADRRRALEALGAEVTGRVEDLVAAYRSATVFANPIRSGGGMRGKVLEAFACGVPVVSTRRGLEGIAAKGGEHCEEADAAEEFARAVVRLIQDPAVREKRSQSALTLVTAQYDVRVVMARLEAAFAEAHAERRGRCGARH